VCQERSAICGRESWENDPVGILEMNAIRQPNSNWRRTARDLLAREEFRFQIDARRDPQVTRELKKEDREAVLRRIEGFDPGGWFPQ
jgi:hypothetical protein